MLTKYWFAGIAAIVLLFAGTGCCTATLQQAAEGNRQPKAGNAGADRHAPQEPAKAHPGLYVLMPIAVPLDIVTFPFQAVYLYLDYARGLQGAH